MSLALVRALGAAAMLLGTIMSLAVTSVRAQLETPSVCPTGIANFGDSLTDTGNAVDAFPYFTDAENAPYGSAFFGAPAKRFSNGRLVPDFFSQAFNFTLLDPYFSVASFDYKNGVNFANAGATAAFSPTALSPFSVFPFQTNQFIRFQNSVNSTQAQLGCANFNVDLPSVALQNPFPTWLYTITAGGNDILLAFENGVSTSYINNTLVPQAVAAIDQAIITLYLKGARRFLVFGVPAAGCSTVVLTYARSLNLPLDNRGCVIAVNSLVQNFNHQLLLNMQILRNNLLGVSIAYFDYYTANIYLLDNAAFFGFNASLTKTACCGAPGNGTLNYNPAITCGHPSAGSNVCPNPDAYINWDGVHFTEAFYRYIAIFALNAVFTDGGPNYQTSCNLDFNKLGTGVTFKQAYPNQTCNNLYT